MSQVRRLHLEMGHFCNTRCIMCYQDDYIKKMPELIWKKKLLPVYKNLDKLIIQGGEVTVMPEVKELIALVKKVNKKVKLGVLTNGLLFGDYWQNELIDNGFMVNFSLNAADEKTYKIMCKHSNYQKVLNNLKNLIKKRNETNSDLEIYISLVIWKENVHDLADFIRFGKKMGVDKVRFFMDINHLVADSNVVEKSVGEAWKAYDEEKIIVLGLASFYKYYCFVKKIKNIYSDRVDDVVMDNDCYYPWIECTGEVKGCCNVSSFCGDLNKNSFEEIWNSKQASVLRNCLIKGDFSQCAVHCPMVKNPKYGWTAAKFKAMLGDYFYKIKKNPVEMIKKIPKKAKKMLMTARSNFFGHKNWWVLLVCAINLFVRLPLANLPVYHDETFYFNGALMVLKNNLWPWVNFSGYKGPVVYEPVALLIGFLGVYRWWARILIYLCSSISIWLVYKLGKKLFGERVGLATAGLLLVMPLFMVHSLWYTDAVPLLMMVLLTLNYYFEGKMFEYFICSLLLVLTKETAIFVPLFLALFGGQWLVGLVPMVGFGIWMLLNKIFLGFYLSPASVDLLGGNGWLQKWSFGIFNWGTLFWLLAVGLAAWQRKKINIKIVGLFLGMYFFYNLVYGITYFNQRYLLLVMPLVIMILVYLLEIIGGKKILMMGTIMMLLVMILIQAWQWQWGRVENGGDDLRVFKIMGLQRQVADYLGNNFADYKVLVTWPLADYISDPFLGYVKKPMTVVSDNSAQLMVVSAVDLDLGTTTNSGWKLKKSWQNGVVNVYEK